MQSATCLPPFEILGGTTASTAASTGSHPQADMHSDPVELTPPKTVLGVLVPQQRLLRQGLAAFLLLQLSANSMECPICMNHVDLHNEAYLYPCFHRYCFSCIQQWTVSQQKHQPVDQDTTTCLCPLCKAPYTQIIYDCVGSTYRYVGNSTKTSFVGQQSHLQRSCPVAAGRCPQAGKPRLGLCCP